MRKGLAVVAAVACLAVAGCSGGDEETPPQSAQPPVPRQPAKEIRKGPEKNVNVTDQCSVLPPDKAQQLGYDQPPQPRNSAGVNGCQYNAKEPGSHDGWGTFAAVDPQTMQQYAARSPQGKSDEVGGFPAHVVDRGSSCLLWVDVSDHGSVFSHSIIRPGGSDKKRACEDVAEPAAEAMIQNLPNA